MTRPETQLVAVDGVRSPVLTSGDPDTREAVVFVHGNPGPKEDWTDLMTRTGEFARAIAPDMPGYGAADHPADFDYSSHGYARHLAGILDQMRIDRAHLVMHDFGGPWGLVWAVEHPEAFASATLINTGVLLDYRWHRLARIWRTPVLGDLFMATSTRAGVRMVVGHDNPRLTPAAIDRIYDASRARHTKRAVLKLYRSTPASAMGALGAPLRELDRPALVVWGTTDAYLPWQQADLQRESFPSARIQLLEGLGHWPFIEDPARVDEVVIPFLREQVGGRFGS
ncbi:MAG TPA: alpha/beta hydrolase [Solirubrobacteraceae bacterium]|nr:alpha/beta hydrolase [Solirubrobacteraceae bacterium]